MAQKRRKRRHWEEDEKRRIVAQTRVPGVSVSQVARRYDVNANLVFKWLRDPRFSGVEADAASFLPVEIVPHARDTAAAGQMEITLPSGERICVSGPYDPDALCRLLRGLRR